MWVTGCMSRAPPFARPRPRQESDDHDAHEFGRSIVLGIAGRRSRRLRHRGGRIGRPPRGPRQPLRPRLRDPDRARCHPGRRPGPNQGRRRRARPAELRPGVPEHGLVPERDHLHRRRSRDPALPRLPDRGAGRGTVVPRRRLSPRPRRAADAGAVWRLRRGGPAGEPTCRRASSGSSSRSPTTPTRWPSC